MPYKSKGYTARIAAAIRPDTLAEVEKIAEQSDQTTSEIFRRAIDQYILQHPNN